MAEFFRKRIFLILAVAVAGFNLWHLSIRGVFGNSVFDALTIGPETLELAQKNDPRLELKNSYDGQFFYAMTYDPLLIKGDAVKYLDNPVYRYHRMLYPLLAHLFSLGRPLFFPYALFMINLIFWASAGRAIYLISKDEGWNPCFPVIAALTVSGLVYTTFRTLSETSAAALVLWGCLAWKKGLDKRAALAFALSGLARETSLFVPLCIAAHDFIKNPRSIKKSAVLLALSILPALVWFKYVSMRIGGTQYLETNRFSFPFIGMVAEAASGYKNLSTHMELLRSMSIVAETLLLILVSAFAIKKYPTFWGALTLGQAFFCLIVKGNIWDFYASSCRAVILLNIFAVLWFLEIDKNKFSGIPCAPAQTSL